MEIDMEDGEGGDEDEWMDVDEEDGTPKKRAKVNSGAVVFAGRGPRSNRQLAGLRDNEVSGTLQRYFTAVADIICNCFHSKRPKPSSSAILVRESATTRRRPASPTVPSRRKCRSICSQANGRWERRTGDRCHNFRAVLPYSYLRSLFPSFFLCLYLYPPHLYRCNAFSFRNRLSRFSHTKTVPAPNASATHKAPDGSTPQLSGTLHPAA